MLREGVCPKQGDPHHGYRRSGPPDDPRWEWVNVQTMSDPDPVWIKGQCRHTAPEPVEVADPLTGDRLLVAKICPDCDRQIWNWADEDLPEPNGFERWAYAPSSVTSSPGDEWWKKTTADAVMEINGRPVELDPYGHLVFVGGGVINKAASVRPVLLRAWDLYCKITLDTWNGFKRTLYFMWPAYLVGVVYAYQLIESGVWK